MHESPCAVHRMCFGLRSSVCRSGINQFAFFESTQFYCHLQNMETVPSIISRTMDVVNGVSSTCSTSNDWWEQPPISSTSNSNPYLGAIPTSYPSPYPFSPELPCTTTQWENRFPPSIFTPNTTTLTAPCYPTPAVSSHSFPAPSREISPGYPSPPPYPYSTPAYPSVTASTQGYYPNHSSPIMDDISPASSPESFESIFADRPVNGIALPQVVSSQPLPIMPPPLSSDTNCKNGLLVGYRNTQSAPIDPKISPKAHSTRWPISKFYIIR